MKIKEICDLLRGFAPEHLAGDFDNVGFLIGREEAEVTKILLTLDVDEQVALEAARLGANLIISHHPVIFTPMRQITGATPEGRTVLTLAENGIAVYSAHTNLDSVAGGLNDLEADRLGLPVLEVLDPKSEADGLGRICAFEGTVGDLAERVKAAYGLSCLPVAGEEAKPVRRVAICSGGGGSMVGDCIRHRVDAYIAGDVSYAKARELYFSGIAYLDLGHHTSEYDCVSIFERILKEKTPETEVFCSKANQNIIKFL